MELLEAMWSAVLWFFTWIQQDVFVPVLLAGSGVAVVGSIVWVSLYCKSMMPYIVAPSVLIAAHLTGESFQHYQVGPAWVQGHLHNVGVVTTVAFVFVYCLAVWRRRFRQSLLALNTETIRRYLRRFMLIAYGGTILGVLDEGLVVLANKQALMAEGYSGMVDIVDIIAYVIGLVVLVVNHRYMSHKVLKRLGA